MHACVWCAWCCRWHHHGHGGRQEPLGAGNGHRVAHCHDDASPYAGHGYGIREIGRWEERPSWQQLPAICHPCGDPFFRRVTWQRYCSPACRRQKTTA